MKKILFCTNTYKTGGGGVASYAHDFVNGFRDKYIFTIVTGDKYLDKESYPVIHIPSCDFSAGNRKKLMDVINVEKPDIIINSYFPLLALVSPYLSNDIRIINISHYTDGKIAYAAGLNANYSDDVIALSTYAKKYLDTTFCINDKTKVKVIYNFMPSLPDGTCERKKKSKVLKIVFPGGHSKHKSSDIVCIALKKLLKTNLNFEFYWLGDTKLPGSKFFLTIVKDIKDCLPIEDTRIKYCGIVSREDAKNIIADSNIFLLPSRGEGCPITLLEAMRGACIPVISNAKHGSLDIIEDGKTGFIVKEDDSDSIVDTITEIIQNHNKYTYIYDNTLDKFKKELSYECWHAQMNALFECNGTHKMRIPFNIEKYISDAKSYKRYLKKEYFKDRFFIQLGNIIIYHWIKLRY